MRKSSLVALLVLVIAISAGGRASAQTTEQGPSALPATNAAETIVYVSPNGNDSNPGTRDQPWRTIQRAATAAGPGTTVYILPGVYREEVVPAQSGTADAPIIYKAADGPGTVSIWGSESASSLTWTPLTSNTIGLPSGVDPANVYWADLSSWDLAAEPYWNEMAGPRFVVQLDSSNNVVRRLPLARAPNWTVTTAWKYSENWWTAEGGGYAETCNPETNSDHNCDTASRSDLQLTDRVHLGAASSLGDLTGGFVRIQDNRSGHYVYPRTIVSHDRTNGRITVNTPARFDSIYPAFGWGSKYYLEDKPQLLDEPGEWWYDPSTRRLYLWAPGSVNPAALKIEISRRNVGFDFGTRSHITLDGVNIEFYRQLATTVSSGAVRDKVANSKLRYCNRGFVLWQDIQFAMENSEIAYMDTTGGFIAAQTPTSYSSDVVFDNNDIHHLAFYSDSVWGVGEGMYFYYANNLRFTNNHVHDIAHNGVQFCGSIIKPSTTTRGWGYDPSEIKTGNILVANNVFERACQMMADCGGLKFWGEAPNSHVYRDVLVAGNIFRDNIGWTHILEKRKIGPEGEGLYVDYASGIHAYRNIAYNNSYAGYYFYGAWRDGEIVYYNNTAANNLFGIVASGPMQDSHGNFNTQFVSNILINNETYGLGLYRGDADWGNLTIDNNLYFANGWTTPMAMLAGVNWSSHSYYPTLNDIQTKTTWEGHGVEGNPHFVSYNLSDHSKALGIVPDLHLTADSSNAIDKGTTALPSSLADLLTQFGITDTRNGVAYDIGAYEFGGIAPPTPTFADVPFEHRFHDDIEILYQNGYTAGCGTDPLRYCPEATMNRAESAVFVERGIHTANYDPPAPSSQVFADMPLDSWAANWVNALWEDRYTVGCGTNPLAYCPWQGHTRAEGSVFYLRMLNGAAFEPPQPTQQTFADVALDTWYAKWVQAAYDAGLLTACQTTPEMLFCPDGPLTRALAAHMMVQAKGLRSPSAPVEGR